MSSLFCLPYMILGFQVVVSVKAALSEYKLNQSILQSIYHEEVNLLLLINSLELRKISMKLPLWEMRNFSAT
jgi:hypothetical protein